MCYKTTDTEQIACEIAAMDRDEITQEILEGPGHFKLDFTAEFLNSLPLERLRHILLAVKLYHQYGQ